ncbi:hypothetical protein HRI_004359400 [Hibiscus trionum]|uniref:STI1 domain-containing protein n=1 Tax=Hibiscus trionum TaxID=183268 RepID=A0A9W7J5A0_HIBTR|nr:hypothetical protein HRI_004359400 [Hibiscus trionum]
MPDSCKMTIDIVESLPSSLDRGGRAFAMGLENKLQENDTDEMSGEGERKRKMKATKGEGKSTKKGCRTDDAGEPSEPELRGNEKPVRVLFIIKKKSHPQVLKILRDRVIHRRKIGAGLGASLFPGLSPLGVGGGGGGGFGLFGSGIPEFEQVQQQLTQNPNMMREIMNTPAIQSLMNNPELMRSLIMSNPQMREIIDKNPELGHILNDPSILR